MLAGPDGGPFDTVLRDYLSSEEVKAALHVDKAPVGRWGMGDALVYVKQHYACFYEEGTPPDAKPEYPWDMLEVGSLFPSRLRFPKGFSPRMNSLRDVFSLY